MIGLKLNDRVSLKKEALSLSYVVGRRFYTNMYEGKTGKVIGFTDSGKIAIQFDDIVFTRPDGIRSSHDNGCHGRGRIGYCWYIPSYCLELISEENTTIDNNLLLLL